MNERPFAQGEEKPFQGQWCQFVAKSEKEDLKSDEKEKSEKVGEF